MTFADDLRAQLVGSSGEQYAAALADVGEWLEQEVANKIESEMQALAARGRDTFIAVRPYAFKKYLYIDEVEALPQYQYLLERGAQLGLDVIGLSHKMLKGRDDDQYPQLEVRVKVPPVWAKGSATKVTPW